jgi:hypothetical protein
LTLSFVVEKADEQILPAGEERWASEKPFPTLTQPM